jgi:hypothetical protein
MTGTYELAEYGRRDNIYDKHALLQEPRLPAGAAQAKRFSLETRPSGK